MKLIRKAVGCKMFKLKDGRYKVTVRSEFMEPTRFSYYYLSAYDAGKDMDMLSDRIAFYHRQNGLAALGNLFGQCLTNARRTHA